MSASQVNEEQPAELRPAFDLFEGFASTSVLAALEMAGILPLVEDGGIDEETIADRDPVEADLLTASLRYLGDRGLVRYAEGVHSLTDLGVEVCRDKGYLVWLVGGYGEPLRRLDAFLGLGMKYGREFVRDGRWVADGAAMLGRKDVVPHAMDLLGKAEFTNVLDLGCGNARFLLALADRFGSAGLGVDISPEACAVAEKAVAAAGLTGKVRIARGDAGDLKSIPDLEQIDLVVTFFLLHEILASGRDRLVGYLSELAGRLPAGAHLLIAEVEPPVRPAGPQRFTPEFTYVHALMRQILLSEPDWHDVLAESGFEVLESIHDGMPGGLLLLCRTAS